MGCLSLCVFTGQVCVYLCVCVWGEGSHERDRRRSLFSRVQPLASSHIHIHTHSHKNTHSYTSTPSVQSSRSLEIWVAMSRKASGAPQSRV